MIIAIIAVSWVFAAIMVMVEHQELRASAATSRKAPEFVSFDIDQLTHILNTPLKGVS